MLNSVADRALPLATGGMAENDDRWYCAITLSPSLARSQEVVKVRLRHRITTQKRAPKRAIEKVEETSP